MNKNKKVDITNLKSSKKSEVCAKQIVSPIAKYDANGNLFCIICKNIVKSHTVWKVHVNSKSHKLNVEKAKKIDKTTLEKCIQNKNSIIPEAATSANVENLKNKPKNVEQSKRKATPPNQDIESTGTLPDMFFDNPSTVNAKARRIEHQNNQNDEWEKFQLEIKKSIEDSKITSGEQIDSELDKEITQISEQMQQWSKVLKLESKLLTIIKSQKLSDETNETDENTSDDEVSDNLDWRSKTFT